MRTPCRLLLPLTFCILLSVGCSSALASAEIDLPSDRPSLEFKRLLDEGQAELAAGELEEALQSFKEADSVIFHEAPNFEALVYVAETKCRLGRKTAGCELLVSFRCMLAVHKGDLPCYVGAETPAGLGDPNPQLTPLCDQRMCSEIYLPYYEQQPSRVTAWLDDLELKLTEVTRTCSCSTDSSQPDADPDERMLGAQSPEECRPAVAIASSKSEIAPMPDRHRR